MRARITTPKWLGYLTLAKHHIQEFGLLKQLPKRLPTSLLRLFSEETLSHLNVKSCLISAILAVLLIATAPEEFGIPECTTTVEAAGLDGPHRWGIILPNSSRVSMLTYKAIVAVRYPELVLHDQNPIQIGHFVPHDHYCRARRFPHSTMGRTQSFQRPPGRHRGIL